MPVDPCSYSRHDDCVVVDIDLDLQVDFTNSVLKGFVILTVEKKKSGVESVILDTRDITIKKVTDQETGQDLAFTLGEHHKAYGSRLEIKLPKLKASENRCKIKIQYETSPMCTALQWLRPEQTAGRRQPYLFSQCQAIHCRSMIPCQDTPSVKCPYSAKISAPKEITILMSALRQKPVPHQTDSSLLVHQFQQQISIPSYLIAIVGGDLESRSIGPRTNVWSEKEHVDEAAYEFGETEEMLQVAESLMGPYVWGQYDLLVLPPSFPFGGMENPCLTFVTPTLLAGDRSLADVVAHEIAHSWTGNLVTNANFEHFWLNEGHTVFMERKIAGKLHSQGEAMRQFKAIGGWKSLEYEVNEVQNGGPYTKLVLDLEGVDPDDSFSTVPYEKGFAFLYYIETLVGGPAIFDPFLKAYIEKFQGNSIVTNQWKDFLFAYFKKQVDEGVFKDVDWDTWLYKQGMPPEKPHYDDSLAKPCTELCKKWSAADDSDLSMFKEDDLKSFQSVQIIEFLAQLLQEPALSVKKVETMEALYKMNDIGNSEIKFKWIRLCIRAKWEDIISRALDFVNEQGRMKFVRPVYRDLYAWDKSKDAAISNFKENRRFMHNTTASLVAKDLHLE